MSKSRTLGFAGSLALVLVLFVVLPGLGADEKDKDGRDGLYRPLGLFTEVLSLVQSNYVEPVETKNLMTGAFSGMTEAMDPFAEYIPPDKMAAFTVATAAREKKEVTDVGLVLAKRLGYPYVVAAIEGGPAAAAGAKSDDVIEKIDDVPARGLAIWEAEARLAGKPGGRVRILVVREGGKPRRRMLEIVRSNWTAARPSVSRVESQIVLRVPSFTPGTADAVKELLKSYDRTKPLLLDVRSNATGTFDEAARAAALFAPAGPLGQMKGRRIETTSYSAPPGERVHESRLVVLVDSGTAGPAELFVAGLREAGAKPGPAKTADGPEKDEASSEPAKGDGTVKLVGEPTFGMGFQSQVVKLQSGGALRISVGKIHTVRGRVLSPRGVEPDDRVYALPVDESAKVPADPILLRGLKVLAEGAAPVRAAA